MTRFFSPGGLSGPGRLGGPGRPGGTQCRIWVRGRAQFRNCVTGLDSNPDWSRHLARNGRAIRDVTWPGSTGRRSVPDLSNGPHSVPDLSNGPHSVLDLSAGPRGIAGGARPRPARTWPAGGGRPGCRRAGFAAALSSGFACRPVLSSGNERRPALKSGTERRAGLSEAARRSSTCRHLWERRSRARGGASGREAPLSSGFAYRPVLSSGAERPTEARPGQAPGRLPWRRQDETWRGPPGKGTHGRTGDHRLHRDGA